MNSYVRFAEVYDALMTDIPYNKYVEWIQSVAPASQYKQLLDIGCGTGTMAALLHEAGYDVVGIDLSEEMLTVAHERLQAQNISIPLIAMSMSELEGFENLDVAIIPIDSINYVTEQENVVETFTRIHNSLREGGQLLFDVHSLNYVNAYLEGTPFTYDDGDITYIWHTEEGDYEHSVYHQITFFVRNEDGTFDRFDEEHFQRTFSIDSYIAMLHQVGFQQIEITADFTPQLPNDESNRIFIRAVK
jgi:ubiquinone/menaquinone biosynthesis C-methylase UbiE